jgi:RecA/RadA recombinase
MVDFTKLRAKLTKSNISIGISEPDNWLSTGNYGLNFNITGDFKRGIPNRRSVMFWGLQGSGKTFLACLAAKEAQDKGYTIVYIDTEDSIHTDYMKKIGIDMSCDDKFMAIRLSTIEEATTVMSDFFQFFNPEDKVCYVIDSLTGMETEAELENFNKGKTTTDMGLFAKRLKQFVKNINNKIGDRDNFLIMTNHAYLNQDIRNGKGVAIPSGGEGFIFLPSISVYLSKLKLKEETDVVGVKITAETTKSRFTQLGRKIRLEVPYDRGIDPIDGLLDMAIEAGLVDNSTKGWYKIIDGNGDEIKFRGKDFGKYYNQVLDIEAETDIVEED